MVDELIGLFVLKHFRVLFADPGIRRRVVEYEKAEKASVEKAERDTGNC